MQKKKLLAHGPNFAVVPKNAPIIQYIAAVEQACTKLEEGEAEEFRVQVKATIQKIQKPKPNITKGEKDSLDKAEERPFQDGTDSR